MNRDITIVQIAKESGVSIATVSRVLNSTVPVAPETRAKVEEVIKKYNYSPNALAQGLIRRQTRTLAVIVPDITNPYFSTLFCAIDQAAHLSNYSVILCNTSFSAGSYAGGERQAEERYFQMILDKKVDGVILAGGQIDMVNISNSYLKALKHLASSIPTIVIGRFLPDIPCTFIDKESGDGILSAVRHLHSLGHKRIAFLGGEPGVYITEHRLQCYYDAMESLHLKAGPDTVFLSDYYLPDGYEAASHLLESEISFTAALTMNDNTALGIIRALTDHGMSVPGDMALISCDQFFNCDYLTPRLTSLNRMNELLGRYVIELLLSIIQESTPPEKVDLSPKLVIRESSGSSM